MILRGLVTTTACEFLLHTGMFRRFSGKDAVRLAHANWTRDGLGDTTRPTAG